MTDVPRRVLMTADAVGGVWTFALDLARGLAAHGVQTTLAVMGPPPSAAQREEARAIVELQEGAFALEWMPEPWEDVARAGEWLHALERAVRPDVVHVNGFAHCALPFDAPVVMGVHSCVCTWFRACRGHDAPASWDRYRDAVQAGLEAADAIAAPTRAMLEAFLEAHDPERRHAARARVIANTVDPARFTPTSDRERVPMVLSAGRIWDEAKDLTALDRVAADLPWPVAIAGSEVGPEGTRAPLRGAVALGPLPRGELAWWMSRAAIYALPARYEPFGLSALEAALSGCALVLGDVPSLRELWGGAARFVAPGDPRALRDAIHALIDDDETRARAARRALERARQLASPARFVRSYLDLYGALPPSREQASACA